MTLSYAWATRRTPGRDVPYAIPDSAQAVSTVTPPEDASEVEATCARSKTERAGAIPCVLLTRGHWARRGESKGDGSATAPMASAPSLAKQA